MVPESAHEDVDVAHDLQHVQALLERPHGEEVVHQNEPWCFVSGQRQS